MKSFLFEKNKLTFIKKVFINLFLLMVTSRRLERMKNVLKTRQADLQIFMDYVYSEHNLAAIVRTADAVNVWKVYYRHQNKIRVNDEIAMKADRWMNIENVKDIESFYKRIKSEWYQVVASLIDEDTIDFREVDYTKPTLVVLWNEVDWISEVTKSYADKKIMIPMYWMSQSLNVSVANAVILYEAQRQRQQAWMYDKMQISEQIYEEILQSWIERGNK